MLCVPLRPLRLFFLPENTGSQSGDRSTYLSSYTKCGLIEPFLSDFSLIIPKAVYNEAIRKGVKIGKYDAYLLEKLVHDGKIQVMQSNKESLKEVQDFFSLHCGESDAISLCKDVKAECLLCDDKKAINACKVLGLKFATALNILSAMHLNFGNYILIQ